MFQYAAVPLTNQFSASEAGKTVFIQSRPLGNS